MFFPFAKATRTFALSTIDSEIRRMISEIQFMNPPTDTIVYDLHLFEQLSKQVALF